MGREARTEDHQKPAAVRHLVNLFASRFTIGGVNTGQCTNSLPTPPLVCSTL